MSDRVRKMIDATIAARGLDETEDQIVIYFRHGKDEEVMRLAMDRENAATFASAIGLMLGRSSVGAITVEGLTVI